MSTSTTSSTPSATARRMLGSDGFYAIARIVLAVVVIVAGSLIARQPIRPAFSLSQPIITLAWAYGIIALLALAAIPLRQRRLSRAAIGVDVLVLCLMTFLNHTPYDLFYPLLVIPLVGAALQLSQRSSLAIGLISMAGYGGAQLLRGAEDLRDPLGLVALLLRCLVLLLIPTLASSLAERWSSANRRSVEVAEQRHAHALGEAKAYRDRTQALYEVAAVLSADPSNQAILDTTLAEGVKLVPYSCGVALLASEKPGELFIAAAYGVGPDDRRRTVQLGTGPISEALREGEPFVVDDLRVEPIFAPIGALTRSATACAIPLRSGLHTYGVLVLGASRADTFTEERVEMLSALTRYALVALQNAQLISDLRGERTKLLSKEEEVRHQLARDLHDGPAQALAAITMNVEFIKRLIERDPPRVIPELDKLGALARHTTHEVRTMLFELRPLALETQGLATTLQQYFERFQGNATKIVLEADDRLADLDTRTEGTLFNIIQESVNNALKHAKAAHIWVRLKQQPGLIEATVQDDGAGFDLAKVRESYEKRGSFGLLNIEERAQLIGGKAELRSAPGQGTTVRVIVPVSQ